MKSILYLYSNRKKNKLNDYLLRQKGDKIQNELKKKEEL